MARERDHFATARSALAEYAGAGRFGWGRPLAATTLAAELGLSPTPVREALAHLAGEGVIEHHPGRGYFAPSLTAADIVGLYDLHAQYLRWTLERSLLQIPLLKHAALSRVGRVEEVFMQIVERGGSEALRDAHRRVSAQLKPVRQVEDLLEDLGLGIVEEIDTMIDSGRSEDAARLVKIYHLDRMSAAPAIEMLMRQTEKSI